MQIPKWHNIRGHTKILNRFFYIRIGDKIHFTCLLREGFNHFIYMLFFNLRVYLALAESKIDKQFISQIDLHCRFLRSCR